MQATGEFHLTRIGQRLTSILLAVCACTVLASAPRASAAQDRPVFASVCAEQEVKAITSLEDHGIADDVPSDQLAAAGLMWLEARATCYAGKVDEAVALYQRVINLESRNAKNQ